MTNLDRVLKSRDITLLTMVCILKATVFPVVMYRCESWTIKKAKRQRIDAFQLWCWRKLLTWTCSWTARGSNQSILKEINLEYITLPTKVHLVKAMVFPVVMYGCESWTMKKAEYRRIDAFELWFWKRLLRALGLQAGQTSQY